MHRAGAWSGRRIVGVSVRDQANALVVGSNISCIVDGVAVGGVYRSTGEAVIELDDPSLSIEIEATAGSASLRVLVSATESFITLVLAGQNLSTATAYPEAQCANGTKGSPCVVCPVGSSSVRICA